MWGNRGVALGALVVLVGFVGMALSAPWLAPHDPGKIDAAHRLLPPGSTYWLGTDRFGRDVLSRLIFGARLSLEVGLSVVLLSSAAGTVLGLVAGYYRRLDNVIMRILDGIMAFPSLVLEIAIMAALGPRVSNVMFALAFVYTPRMARVVRSAVLVEREKPYVEAARAIGCGDFRCLCFHLLPNSMAPALVQATMVFAYAVLSEASLSFLGVGVPPEVPSWGNMLSEGKDYLRTCPWLTVFPGAAIALCVLALNTCGDVLRDALDPKLRKIGR